MKKRLELEIETTSVREVLATLSEIIAEMARKDLQTGGELGLTYDDISDDLSNHASNLCTLKDLEA